MNIIHLAQLARDAALSDYTLRTIAAVSKPFVDRRGPSAPILTFDDSALPAWEKQMLGQVRAAGSAANAFIDMLGVGIRHR